MKKLIRIISARLYDPERSLDERHFEMLTIISVIVALLAVIGDILEGENYVEIIVLLVTVTIVPIITYFAVTLKKVQLAAKIVAIGLVFAVNPVIFYFGGGVNGGGVLWVVFSFLYIGLILMGLWRIVMLTLLTLFTIGEYAVSYMYPDVVYKHSGAMIYTDSLISVILVGLVIFSMVWFQNRQFLAENKRAREETARAEDAIRAQNQFFSSMSHEIRTPINSILGLNEIILRSDEATDEIAKDAANIQGAGRMLLALVNDILDVSKIEAGKMDIVPVNYNVGGLISEIVNMIWLRADEKGLDLKVDIDPQVPKELFGDEVRIKQILINLLNNAVKYTSAGIISLHLESESKGEDSVFLTISVTDTGMGIKQDAIPHLFDAFQRIDEEKNRYIEGTGLGLSIVKQLVELMDGKISVNSVYTQGSTFKVVLPQAVTNKEPIGNINITNYEAGKDRDTYKHSFIAPEASILIVDDNEMNLEVEKKLLQGTEIRIDTATSGEQALIATLEYTYDVIFMDHLMPEMDGIECIGHIRRQAGGLNRHVPIIVLTANAGSENQQLYTLSGFDGYLLKPVSGKQLEETLLAHIPQDKIENLSVESIVKSSMSTASDYKRKTPVLITTSSVCDLPPRLTREIGLDIIPYIVRTEAGVFWDNLEMDSQEILHYIDGKGGEATSEPPSEKDFEEFFAREIQKTHHIIHISMINTVNEEYDRAVRAARAFENVTVLNSGVLSSAMGLLVLMAYRMTQQNFAVERIVAEIENLKNSIHCSFVVSEPDYLAKRGFYSERLSRFLSSLNMHPGLAIKSNSFDVGKIFLGTKKRYISSYIKYAGSRSRNPDNDIVFVTYAGMEAEEIEYIEKEVRKRFNFENIVIQQASAAVTLNCGPGAFGLLFADKSKLSLKLSKLLPGEVEQSADVMYDEMHTDDSDLQEIFSVSDMPSVDEMLSDNETETESISIPGIDMDAAIKNSGSEDAFRSVLEIFYESIPDKLKELQDFFDNGDWRNYTIKAHSLKSSARLVGAIDLAENAYALEMAGDEDDVDFIVENHDEVMDEYRTLGKALTEFFGENDTEEEQPEEKAPVVADMVLIEALYDAIRQAAKDMDVDVMEEAFAEIEAYVIPESEQKRFLMIKNCYEQFDYDKILVILDKD